MRACARSDNDTIAADVFREMGQILGASLKQILMEDQVEALILGGQISNAFDLFGESLSAALSNVPSLRKVTRAMNIDKAPLLGIAKMLFEKDGLLL